ncbi:DeoR family transcriptional regulator [Emticicia sp. CRIBPO]|uniref:DeoR/GlpR family DNA-binding transcription regulator n=1 Tax=Emticicia sp. CRIBPO TaxID=2683258 RepID=UPI0014129F64|nr:DeoR/GlpR family DNA-binding transcription regulator [Emticicia sp. CRIBPO]NBA86862.1 DeoR family transcriptional regulator [Emticicia sp. CRIBPO]
MLKEKRFDYILEKLDRDELVDYKSLAADLGISEDTARRDIQTLHKHGLLSIVSGGAVKRSKNPLSFQDRTSYLTEGKDVIALKAQQFIRNGQTIFMDGGTTICAIASRFPMDASFRVVTNNVALIPVLSNYPGIEVVVLGGLYNKTVQTNFGIYTYREVASYRADLYFMGTCAVDRNSGVTASLSEEGEIKKVMLAQSAKNIAISNAEKLNSTFHFRVCDTKDIDVLITDLPSNDPKLDHYRGIGVELV